MEFPGHESSHPKVYMILHSYNGETLLHSLMCLDFHQNMEHITCMKTLKIPWVLMGLEEL